MIILLKKMNVPMFCLALMMGTVAHAEELDADIQPFTKAEMQQGMQAMKQGLHDRIEAWGANLKPEDFERSWTGRQLNKQKRQEVCGIFQDVIDHTFKLAVDNKARLPEVDQNIIEDRNLFIQSFGYKDNIVDTKMGFNCRLR
ncbi:hypothetical protein [Acinetobacter portensis]|uniref:hypothetical protein n=2 Tax=Acinetobacter portensis TaxID=1839785 RepID=UPI001E611967|nr:hypothetical protein [Acinetobacter portensis]